MPQIWWCRFFVLYLSYQKQTTMKNTFILSHFNKPVAVIQIGGDEPVSAFEAKLKKAIIEEVSAETDGQFELKMQRLGDYGESTKMTAKYVEDGCLIRDEEFTLMKTVCY